MDKNQKLLPQKGIFCVLKTIYIYYDEDLMRSLIFRHFIFNYLQMRQSMNTVAVKKRRKSHLSKKESQGIDPSNNT